MTGLKSLLGLSYVVRTMRLKDYDKKKLEIMGFTVAKTGKSNSSGFTHPSDGLDNVCPHIHMF